MPAAKKTTDAYVGGDVIPAGQTFYFHHWFRSLKLQPDGRVVITFASGDAETLVGEVAEEFKSNCVAVLGFRLETAAA